MATTKSHIIALATRLLLRRVVARQTPRLACILHRRQSYSLDSSSSSASSSLNPYDELFQRIVSGTVKMASNMEASTTQHSVLDSSFPVLLPYDTALFMPDEEFQGLVKNLLADTRKPVQEKAKDEGMADDAMLDTTSASVSDTNPLKRRATSEAESNRVQKSAFMEGLQKHDAHLWTSEDLERENKMLTENADVTNISAKNPLVDLFYDLGEYTAGDKLKTLLENAWNEDALMTLKIIFNARSIHLGKSNKIAAYKAFGWLAETHPLTFLTSLRWLVRPIIEKKAPKPRKDEATKADDIKSEDQDFEMIDAEPVDVKTDPSRAFDVRFGVSHGYWKDLLNLVVFAASDQLKFNGDPSSLLNQKVDNSGRGKRKREWDQATAKELRKQKKIERHRRVVQKLEHDGFYRALHTTVARLFAEQLKEDLALLNSGKNSDVKKISLAAKWAPTFGEFHDKHTFILSTIAEILFPKAEEVCPDREDRELYLRHAREAYRKTYGSPLRKALSIVEREITTNNFGEIKYDRVPSLAMDRYTPLFIKKDYEHFSEYVNKVAGGDAKISGATLLPSTLVSKARNTSVAMDITGARDLKAVKASVQANIVRKVIDGQWKTLVQRIKDSGTLESSIAICDVSGSMSWPTFKDGSCPMDSAIGLSLLLAEVTAPPFGGSFITFSESPTVVSVGGDKDPRGLIDKVKYIQQAPWGMNTNFVAVFENLILPMAVHHNLKQEDMVKQVFVFSDMQFDSATQGSERWTSSFERIKQKFEAASYEMPRLIFWNLAGVSTSKPTTMDDVNTALVSGYSQGMLKTFLDGGGFEDTEEEEVVEETVVGEDGMTEVKVKQKMDPMTIVRKAISHKAYSMLEVVD